MIKNKLPQCALFLLMYSSSFAQFTLRVAGGYAGAGFQNTESVTGTTFNPATPQVDALGPLANSSDSLKTYKPVHGSYGAGGNINLGLGYMFNNFIGLELGIGYAHSNTISCNEVIALPPPATGYLNATVNSYSWAIGVAPSVVVTGEKTGWKVYPYSRLGISLPVAGNLTDNVTVLSPYNLNAPTLGWLGNRTDVTLVTKATVSVGVNGAVGVAYKPLPFLNVFVEVNAQYLNVKGKSSQITKWNATIDSAGTTRVVNDIPLRGVYRDQFTYVDQLTSSSNNAQYNSNYNPNAPKQDLRPIVPGSSLGFNVGVTFFLSKKTLKKDNDKNKPKNTSGT